VLHFELEFGPTMLCFELKDGSCRKSSKTFDIPNHRAKFG